MKIELVIPGVHVHDTFCWLSPGQFVPLFAGVGLLHDLVWDIVPLGLSDIQVLQHPIDDHDDQFPSEISIDYSENLIYLLDNWF